MNDIGRMLISHSKWFAIQLTGDIVFRWLPDTKEWSVYETKSDLLSDWEKMTGYWDVNE